VAREYIKDRGTGARTRDSVDKARASIAQLVWLSCVACAVVLAVGALLIALDARRGNDLVSAVLQGADAVDLGVFERNAGVFDFRGEGSDVKNVLVNWGLAAVAWLVVGRILDRLIRP